MSVQMWRTRPFANHLQHLVDGLYEQPFAPFSAGNPADGGSTGFQSLPVNVWKTDGVYLATLLTPGVDEQTITVTVHEGTLVIEGALDFQAPPDSKPVWREFASARFRRSLKLGAAVDSSQVEALYRNGLLTITMPKAHNSKPRQIEVQLTPTAAAK